MARSKAFRKVNTNLPEVQQLQLNVEQFIGELFQNPILSYTFLENVILTAGTNVVEHKLSRKWRGYIVCARNANETVWDAKATQEQSELYVELAASGPVTVSLYIF